ncbi:MAG: glycosyl transferase family 2 [Anaerolineae bacterium]|nr:MAG: glycosyl transferase family 2 [Anaerolineae bacterium]WKZ44270.1 MAG: glycosyltransferase family 2 protein [Anaerolineales bacterium]
MIHPHPLPLSRRERGILPDFKKYNIVVVVPCYRVEREIQTVLQGIPKFVKRIIVVDDASPDSTSTVVSAIAAKDKRITLVRHTSNQGVGGAMVTGFRKALELGAQIVVKIDGDGQMDTTHLPELIAPLINGQADYTKGNRFRDFVSLQQMPLVRRVGNMGLAFLSKAATGYWHLFDPTNGFTAIRAEVLAELPLEKIDRTYYFETSMLANLYLLGAAVKDVPMPARYRSEVSNMLIHRILFQFPFKLFGTLLKRLVLKNYIYDFTMGSIYILVGLPLLLFGLIFGVVKWIQYASLNIPAPTGTVMLPTLSVLLGIQLLLSAIEIDLRSVPKEPLSNPL